MTVTPLRVDPVRLAEFTFNVDLWDTPAEILRSVFTPHSKTFVQACHSSSKTHTAAVATVLAVLLGGDVVTTAPTDTQVERLLWKDVHRVLASGRIPPSEWGTVNLKDMRLPTGETAFGFATKPEDDGVRFQGFHARPGAFLLLIVDEALGVSPSIFTAIEGIAAGGDVRRLYLCNPTIASGPVYDIARSGDPSWRRLRIDAFETPNLAGLQPADLLTMSEDDLDVAPRPYLVTRRWVKERLLEWGEDAPAWQSRVRGRWPDQGDDALISLGWIEEARQSDPEVTGPLTAGIDVAGPGEDETVVSVRQGGEIREIAAFSAPDARGPVTAMLRRWLPEGLTRVNYDEAGQGWYFGAHLREQLPERVVVNGVNVGESTTTPQAAEQFVNLKAELYWSLRERFRDGEISGLTDQTTISQLAGLRYEHDSKGRVKIESKDDARKRGVKSPDRAEALMLAFAPRSQREMLAGAMGQGARYGGTRPEPKRVQRGAARRGRR